MATGPQMFDVLRHAMRERTAGSEILINSLEAKDLQKLRPSDLIERGYGEEIAEQVCTALLMGDYDALADSMRLRLRLSYDAPRLLPEENS